MIAAKAFLMEGQVNLINHDLFWEIVIQICYKATKIGKTLEEKFYLRKNKTPKWLHLT